MQKSSRAYIYFLNFIGKILKPLCVTQNFQEKKFTLNILNEKVWWLLKTWNQMIHCFLFLSLYGFQFRVRDNQIEAMV